MNHPQANNTTKMEKKEIINQACIKQHMTNEVVVLIRLLQQKDVGKYVNLEETIREYECSKVPQALCEPKGSMRHGCKAAVLKETDLKMEEK